MPRTDPATGDPLFPDHGLLFPTAEPDVLIRRQGVPLRTVQTWEIAPHAFPPGTPEGQRLTVVAEGAVRPTWWGGVDAIGWPPQAAGTVDTSVLTTVAELYEAVTADASPTEEDLFAVYPFLKEGVFLQRNERSDWQRTRGRYLPVECPKNDPDCETSPDRDPAFPECVDGQAPQPSGAFGSGVPPIAGMAYHVAACQAAIERALPLSGAGVVEVPPGTYRIDRHLAVRKPTEIRLPSDKDAEHATVELGRAGYPQGGAFFVIPSWEAFAGAGTTCADGAFCDELVYGEPVPAVRFDDVGRGEPSTLPDDEIQLPIPPPPEFTPQRELYLRRGRSDHDSVEPFATGWHEMKSVRGVDTTGDGQDDACIVRFFSPLGARPLVMQMTVGGVVTEDGSHTGDNFEDGVLRVTLAEPTTKALKTDNPDLFSVPRWRTRFVWTNPDGTTVTTRLLHRKTRDSATNNVSADVLYPVGSTVLRLCPGPKEAHALQPGATAEWSRESWAFLPYTEPRGARIAGLAQARPGSGARNVVATVQAYTCRDVRADDVRAEVPAGLDTDDRIDRAVILTSTERAEVGRAVLVTPKPTTQSLRTWAADLQQSRDTIVERAEVVGSLGGGVQFEEAYDEQIATGDDPLDVTVRDLAANLPLQGTLLSTTYTSRNCRLGRVVVRPYAPDPAQPVSGDAFLRVRHGLVGVAGEPSAANPRVELAVRALDLGADTRLVRPHYVDPFAFGDSGQDAFVYRAGQGSAITWAAQTLAVRLPLPSNDIPLPQGETGPFVAIVPGVVRTLDASLQGTDGVLLYHRQGGSVVASGPVTPEQSADADAAMQVYTGRGWRPYGLLIAVPPPGGWPAFAALRWSGEHFVANVPAEQPAPGAVFGTAGVTVSGIQPGTQTTSPFATQLPPELQGAGFAAGFRFRLVDAQGDDATITGGKARIDVRARYRVDGTLNSGFALQQYVAGPNVEPTGTQLGIDLVSSPRAVAPARGERLYWPATDRVPGETISGRELFARLVTQGTRLPDGTEIPFQLSSDATPFELVVEALVTR